MRIRMLFAVLGGMAMLSAACGGGDGDADAGPETITDVLPERPTEPLQTDRVTSPEWDEPTRAWVIDQLAEPTARFLERHGKPSSFWDLNH